MAIYNLIMPEKMETITVKIMGSPYYIGDPEDDSDVYMDVIIFGDPRRTLFRVKIGATIWHSLYKELKWDELSGEEDNSIDENLEILNRKIITIRGIPDISRVYKTKDGSLDSPKIFDISIRNDLMEADREGGDIYNNAVKKEVTTNRSCHKCIKRNLDVVEKKEREAEIKIEWVKKKKEREEKAGKELKRLDSGGWK